MDAEALRENVLELLEGGHAHVDARRALKGRSEERRVGKEC